MIDLDKLPDRVLNAIANNRGVDWNSDQDAARLQGWAERASVEDAFNAYLTWNGLLGGWASQLIHALDSIRAAEVKEPSNDQP